VVLGSSNRSATWRLAAAGLAGLMLSVIAGCGPDVSRSDLGTVVFDLPQLAGADRPYEMPGLDKPRAAKSDAKSKDTGQKGGK
jgi:hypothetical protein